MLGNVDPVVRVGAMQSLVEHQVRTRRNVLPGSEGTRLLAVGLRFAGIVQVLAKTAAAAASVVDEQLLQFREQIGFGTEMAEMAVALFLLLLHLFAHPHAVVTMKGVAFDDLRVQLLAVEDVLEALHHGTGTGAG